MGDIERLGDEQREQCDQSFWRLAGETVKVRIGVGADRFGSRAFEAVIVIEANRTHRDRQSRHFAT